MWSPLLLHNWGQWRLDVTTSSPALADPAMGQTATARGIYREYVHVCSRENPHTHTHLAKTDLKASPAKLISILAFMTDAYVVA